jgi:hypothetical protein
MSKTPNLRQPPTGPVVYASIKLPPVVTIPKGIDPALPSRINQGTPPTGQRVTPAPAQPLGPMTNTPNQVR